MAFTPRALALNGVGYPSITLATNGVLFGGVLPPLPEPIESALAGVIVLQSKYGLLPTETLTGAIVESLQTVARVLPLMGGVGIVTKILGIRKTGSTPGAELDDEDSGVI